jgi:YesN/AraC family two-component response regulator
MKKILVVDDEYQNREMLSDFLELKGFTVVTANDGMEGLKTFQKGNIDAAIIDIKMPVMNGIDCAAAIRKIKPNFPIIMITGHADSDYQKHIKKLGIQHLLIKPLNINEIEKILRSFF